MFQIPYCTLMMVDCNHCCRPRLAFLNQVLKKTFISYFHKHKENNKYSLAKKKLKNQLPWKFPLENLEFQNLIPPGIFFFIKLSKRYEYIPLLLWKLIQKHGTGSKAPWYFCFYVCTIHFFRIQILNNCCWNFPKIPLDSA